MDFPCFSAYRQIPMGTRNLNENFVSLICLHSSPLHRNMHPEKVNEIKTNEREAIKFKQNPPLHVYTLLNIYAYLYVYWVNCVTYFLLAADSKQTSVYKSMGGGGVKRRERAALGAWCTHKYYWWLHHWHFRCLCLHRYTRLTGWSNTCYYGCCCCCVCMCVLAVPMGMDQIDWRN